MPRLHCIDRFFHCKHCLWKIKMVFTLQTTAFWSKRYELKRVMEPRDCWKNFPPNHGRCLLLRSCWSRLIQRVLWADRLAAVDHCQLAQMTIVQLLLTLYWVKRTTQERTERSVKLKKRPAFTDRLFIVSFISSCRLSVSRRNERTSWQTQTNSLVWHAPSSCLKSIRSAWFRSFSSRTRNCSPSRH